MSRRSVPAGHGDPYDGGSAPDGGVQRRFIYSMRAAGGFVNSDAGLQGIRCSTVGSSISTAPTFGCRRRAMVAMA